MKNENEKEKRKDIPKNKCIRQERIFFCFCFRFGVNNKVKQCEEEKKKKPNDCFTFNTKIYNQNNFSNNNNNNNITTKQQIKYRLRNENCKWFCRLLFCSLE